MDSLQHSIRVSKEMFSQTFLSYQKGRKKERKRKKEKERTLPNYSYKANMILILKPGKYTTTTKKRKLQYNIHNKHRFKSAQEKHLETEYIHIYITKIIYHDQVGFIPDIQGQFHMYKSINVINCTNGLEDKKHMIISIDTAKVLVKT